MKTMSLIACLLISLHLSAKPTRSRQTIKSGGYNGTTNKDHHCSINVRKFNGVLVKVSGIKNWLPALKYETSNLTVNPQNFCPARGKRFFYRAVNLASPKPSFVYICLNEQGGVGHFMFRANQNGKMLPVICRIK